MNYLYTIELLGDPLADSITFTDSSFERHEINYGRSGNVTVTVNRINKQFSVPPEFYRSVTWAAGCWRNLTQEEAESEA